MLAAAARFWVVQLVWFVLIFMLMTYHWHTLGPKERQPGNVSNKLHLATETHYAKPLFAFFSLESPAINFPP